MLVAGNGGSCSDAEHFVGELQCTYKDRARKPVSAISLASLPAAITAWCNDFEFLTFYKSSWLVEQFSKLGIDAKIEKDVAQHSFLTINKQ